MRSLLSDTFASLFSSDVTRRKWTLFLLLGAGAGLSLVMAFVSDTSVFLYLGMVSVLGLVVLFFQDPLLFLVCLVPFRMALDYFGGYVSLQIGESFSLSLAEAVGLLVFGVGILFFVVLPNARASIRIFLPFWVLLLWAGASSLYSIVPDHTLRDVVRVFDILALASIACAFSFSFKDTKRVLVGALFSAVVPMAFGIYQYVTHSGFVDEASGLIRLYGTFGHPNVFGLFLAMIVIFAFFFHRFFAHTNREKKLALCTGFLALLLLVPTYSRVSWGMLALFAFLVGIARFRKWLAPAIIIVILFGTVALPVRERVLDVFVLTPDSSVLWRMNIWNDALLVTRFENRELFGFGLDAFPAVVTSLHTREFGSADAHNDVVKFFVEGGVIGLAIYLFWMGSFVVKFFLLKHDRKYSDRERELFLFLGLLLLSVLVASLSDALFKSTPIQWLLWITVGSVLGAASGQRGNVLSERAERRMG